MVSALVIVTANLLVSNPSPEALVQELVGLEPDVLGVQELSPEAATLLREQGSWTHMELLPRDDGQGIGLLSTAPLQEVEVVDLLGTPALQARTQGWTAVVVHLAAPLSLRRMRHRNRQLDLLTELVGELEGPVVLMGDFNHWPHGRRWRALEDAGLLDCGRRIGRTWPDGRGGPPVRIDHVLVSADHECADTHTSPGVGSDHRAVRTYLD